MTCYYLRFPMFDSSDWKLRLIIDTNVVIENVKYKETICQNKIK